ncbi:MAG TPA: sigma factor, partial [Polyangiaceae bacterium]|nr:sigma factor [Polyangiaceae bacterium]
MAGAPGVCFRRQTTGDLELVRRSVETPTSFAELYDRHGGRFLRYVGTVNAEDIAADVFVRAYGRRASCRGEHGRALPWLLDVANHVIADHRRVEGRRLRALERLAEAEPANVEHEHAWRARDCTWPDAPLSRKTKVDPRGCVTPCSSHQLVASLVTASAAEQKSASQTGVLLGFGRRSGLARAWPEFTPSRTWATVMRHAFGKAC